ncbi:MAG TPA: TldD/PmbA family protein [Verrucomicrobiae bacterium]|nr:TldD/PmbA family protein [Verrucomicrobiae bacterium]
MPAKTKKRAAPRKRVSSGSKGLAAVDHRLGAAELRRIAERIFKLSEADETEVDVSAVTSALTRFANNTIHQNVAEQGITISVRAVVDGRTARASTNKTDDESLRRVTVAALELAQVQPRNPDLLPMLGPQKLQKVARFNAKTAAATPVDRARAVARVCKMADEKKQTTAGIYSTGLSEFALADSRGLFEYYEDTRAEFSVTMLETDSSGWAKATSGNIGDIDPDALAASASQKSADSHEPKEIPAGHYTTILEPPAVLDLVGFLFYDFAGTSVLDQRSCFTGRMGKKLFGENISIWDDVYHPLQLGPPFDGEGLPRQRVRLVDRGIPVSLVYSRATAAKMKAKPTGHGFSLPTEDGEAPFNLVFSGGEASTEEMIRSTERGLLITRLWYIREVDPYKKVLTGMTRDGTFLVENGRVSGAVRNFRFNQSIIEMLANVEMMGPAVRASGEESFDMVVPAMKVRDFHFTEVTKF